MSSMWLVNVSSSDGATLPSTAFHGSRPGRSMLEPVAVHPRPPPPRVTSSVVRSVGGGGKGRAFSRLMLRGVEYAMVILVHCFVLLSFVKCALQPVCPDFPTKNAIKN